MQKILLILIVVYCCIGNIHSQSQNEIFSEQYEKLHAACSNSNLNSIEKILSENPDCINIKGKDNKSALHIATESGNLDICTYLLQQCADIESQDNQSLTPVWYAVGGGNIDIVKLFVENGANYDTRGSTRVTSAFLFSIMKGQLDSKISHVSRSNTNHKCIKFRNVEKSSGDI